LIHFNANNIDIKLLLVINQGNDVVCKVPSDQNNFLLALKSIIQRQKQQQQQQIQQVQQGQQVQQLQQQQQQQQHQQHQVPILAQQIQQQVPVLSQQQQQQRVSILFS
jgi:hypothetical protein